MSPTVAVAEPIGFVWGTRRFRLGNPSVSVTEPVGFGYGTRRFRLGNPSVSVGVLLLVSGFVLQGVAGIGIGTGRRFYSSSIDVSGTRSACVWIIYEKDGCCMCTNPT